MCDNSEFKTTQNACFADPCCLGNAAYMQVSAGNGHAFEMRGYCWDY